MPFTNSPWDGPAVIAKLTPEELAQCSLIDLNPPGQKKIKDMIKLPVRESPSAPYNMNALRNAAARLPQTDAPADAKRQAARKLVTLMREAKVEPGEATMRMAGMR